MTTEERAETKKETGQSLLDVCLDVLEDREDSLALQEEIAKARQELKEMLNDFDRTVSEQPQNIQQECTKEIEYAHDCFRLYEEAIDVIESYFKTQDKFDIVRGAEKVRSATNCMNTAFLNFRNKALIAMGPTDIPVLNLVLDTHKKLTEASEDQFQAYADKLIHIIQREHIIVHRAFPELNRENLFPEEELLKKAYERHQVACFSIRDNVRNYNKEGLDQAIEEYSQAVQSIKELIPAVNLKRMTQKPTSSPQANLVINLARTLINGTGTEEMFLEALKSLEEEFNNIKMQFEAIKRQPTDSVLLKEEIPIAEEALKAFESGITDFYHFLEVRDSLLIEQAATKLEDASNRIKNCSEVFQSIAEREGKTLCIRCSHYNLPDRKTCENCGALLPAAAEFGTARTFEIEEQVEPIEAKEQEETVMTENIYKLFDAVNKVSEGQISIEEFKEIVDWMEQLVHKERKAYGPVPVVNIDSLKDDIKEQTMQVKDMLEEAKEVFREGTEDILAGLTFFRQYISQGDKNNLVLGVQVIWQGVGKLQKVQKVTEILKRAQDEAKQK